MFFFVFFLNAGQNITPQKTLKQNQKHFVYLASRLILKGILMMLDDKTKLSRHVQCRNIIKIQKKQQQQLRKPPSNLLSVFKAVGLYGLLLIIINLICLGK